MHLSTKSLHMEKKRRKKSKQTKKTEEEKNIAGRQ
jgi:hypothetical protein